MLTIRANVLHANPHSPQTAAVRVRLRASVSRGRLADPFFIVLLTHATASTGAEATGTEFARRNSVHITISRKGEVVQLLPFDKICGAVGTAEWRGFTAFEHASICVSLENDGRLYASESTGWRSRLGRRIPDEDVICAAHGRDRLHRLDRWQAFPPQQIETALHIVGVICQRFPISEIVCHDEIAWPRESGPGPAFPREEFRRMHV